MEAIAIIGMSCRLPGASSPKALWQMLCRGENAISDVPPSRWNSDRFYHPDPKQVGKMYTKRGGFLDQEQIEGFDAPCFGISPREALHLDPQQRIMLELAWEVFEDAGIPYQQLAGSATGVYFGFGVMEYAFTQLRYPHLIDAYTNTGYYPSIISNRVSYTFDLRGPSLSLDTACSSSLVSVHLACESLRQKQTNLALAGGVCLMIDPLTTVAFCKLSALSQDGQCKTFDERANGYVRGEGAGIVLLKRLEDAVADGDRIYAVILGEAVNQDGRSNGLTAPNRLAQEAVLEKAYAAANYRPGDVQYIEAHGTGTFLGDPIELNAIGHVMRNGRATDRNLLVGSLKTNIGHLEAAAGVAGLIKLALCVQNGAIPPHLNFANPNPHISFESLKTEVVTELRDWPAHDGPRTAGISAFGFGGTNAHVVVGQTPANSVDNICCAIPGSLERLVATRDESTVPSILLLSTRDPIALQQLEKQYAAFLEAEGSEQSWGDICQASALKRSHLEYRSSIVASNHSEAIELLSRRISNPSKASKARHRPKSAFLFSGQGSQYFQMGFELYSSQPVFRKIIDDCDELLKPFLHASLCDLLFHDQHSSQRLNQTAITQPAIFALQWGLVELWKSWGIVPNVVLGHSVGEIAAACTAGMLDWQEGLIFSAKRGALMQSIPMAGGMLAVLESRRQVADWIDKYQLPLSIAASNGPKNTVVSGTDEALGKIVTIARQANTATIRLNVSHAFHSELVHPILDQLFLEAAKIAWRPSVLPYIANLTGELVESGTTFTPEYLQAHARSEVCFAKSIQKLIEWAPAFVIEVGSDTTLVDIARKSEGADRIQWNASLKRGRSENQTLLSTLGSVYQEGADVDWTKVYPNRATFVDLPKYPFQRIRYWESAPIPTSVDQDETCPMIDSDLRHPLLGQRLDTQLPVYQNRIDLRQIPWLADHRIANRIVFPGAAMVEMLLAAAIDNHQKNSSFAIEEIRFLVPILLDPSSSTTVQCTLLQDDTMSIAARGSPKPEPSTGALSPSVQNSPWTTHCTARIVPSSSSIESRASRGDFYAIRERVQQGTKSEEVYQQLSLSGLEYGSEFRRLERFIVGDSDAWGEIRNVENDSQSPWYFSPKSIDAAFHLVAAMLYHNSNRQLGKNYIPAKIERVELMPCSSPVIYSRATLVSSIESESRVIANIELFSDQGQAVGSIQGIQFVPSIFPTASKQISFPPRVLQSRWRKKNASPINPILSENFVYVGNDNKTVEPLKDNLLAAGHTWRGLTWEAIKSGSEDNEFATPTQPISLILADDLQERKLSKIDIWDQVEQRCRAMHEVFNRMAEKNTLARVVLLTRGVQPSNPTTSPEVLSGHALAGWFRALRLESSGLRCLHLDFDPSSSLEAQWPIAAHELQNASDELDMAIRQKVTWVHSLEDIATISSQASTSTNRNANSQLSFRSKGSLDYLEFIDQERLSPKSHEVLIRVRSTGLNFRDVLNVLGMYPGDAGPLGGECSGVIEEIGADVSEFQVGDEVVAIAAGSFAELVSTPASLVAHKPMSLTMAEAASLPIATLTASIALRHFGKIKSGDRILIHAAAGGVGLAAVRCGLQSGATIYATAGTKEKREILKAMGVTCVSDSRSLQFVHDFENALDGQRFDIVLNSLTGEFIPNSLPLLKSDGAFIEIGKIGTWEDDEVARKFPRVRYHRFDLAELSRSQPEWIGSMLRSELSNYQSIHDRPRVIGFPIADATEAFRYMAQAKQIGKIVVTQPMRRRDDAKTLFNPFGSYIVTGGLGSLGRQLLSWMIGHGAKSIVLPTHRPLREDERIWIERLRNSDVDIVAHEVDMTTESTLVEWIALIDSKLKPILGFFHLSGKLHDSLAIRMPWENYRAVLEAKAKIAWNFHNALRAHDLDCFVMFSSIAALFGSPGQSNYAAANAFLDGLTELRRSQGLPATSLQWGPWEGDGMAANFQTSGPTWGVHPLSPEAAFEAIEKVLRADDAKIAILRLDAKTFSQSLDSRLSTTMMASLTEDGTSKELNPKLKILQEWREKIGAAIPSSVPMLIAEFLRATAVDVLRLPTDTIIDPRQPLNELGLDSLMAVEMQSLLSDTMQLQLDTTLLFDHPTLEALERQLAKQWVARYEKTVSSPSLTATQLADAVSPYVRSSRPASANEVAEPNSSDFEASSVEQIAQELAEELMLLRRGGDESR